MFGPWPRWVFGVPLASSAVGCGSPAFTVELPDEVAYVMTFSVNSEGEISSDAAVVPHTLDSVHRIEVSGDFAWVLGYVDHPLDAVGVTESAPRLRYAQSCEPRLERALAAWTVDGEKARTVTAEEIPLLTLDALASRCADLSTTRLAADFSVGGQSIFCQPNLTVRGCSLSVELAGCDATRLEGRAWPDGSICLETSGRCGAIERRAFASASFDCRTDPPGTGNLYLVPEELPIRVEEVEVVPGVEWNGNRRGVLDSMHGLIRDFVVFGDSVVALTDAGGRQNLECTGNDVSKLHFIDRERLEVTRTTTVSGCMQRLAAGETGLWASAAIAGHGYVYELDAEGRLRDRRDVGTFHSASAGSAVALGVYEQEVMALFNESFDRFWQSRVAHIREGGVEWAAIEGTSISYATPYRRGLLAGDSEDDQVLWIEPGRTAGDFLALIPHFDSVGIGPTVYHEGLNLYVASLISDTPRIVTGNDSSWKGESVFLEVSSQVYAMTVWPKSGLLLTAATPIEATEPVRLAFYDIAEHRYLPGAYLVDGALARTAIADPEDRVWISLPWEGKLLRVTGR